MRRLSWISIGLLPLWAVVVWNYWQISVPVLPTTIISPGKPFDVIGTTAAGEVVTALPSGGKNGPRPARGPVQVWRLADGELSRSLDLPGGFENPVLLNDNLLKVTQDGRCLLYDVSTLELIETLPAGASALFSNSADANLVAFIHQGRLTVRDIQQGRDLWSRDGVRTAHPGSADLILTQESPDRKNIAKTILDVKTGSLITRFDHLGPIFLLRTAANCPYALIQLVDLTWVVCRLATGERLWTGARGEIGAGFTEDGEGIFVHQRIATGGSAIGVRRCIDGEWIESPRIRQWPATGSHRATSNIRYTLLAGEFSLWPGWILRGRNWLQGSLSFPLPQPPMVQRYRLLESPTGATIADLGAPPKDSNSTEIWLRNFQGLLINRDSELHYFALPPRRNWTWLATWTGLPPAVLLTVLSAWRHCLKQAGTPIRVAEHGQPTGSPDH